LIDTAQIMCPDKVDFQNISLTWNTVAECIDDIADNLSTELC
jgi:hypothetical protein